MTTERAGRRPALRRLLGAALLGCAVAACAAQTRGGAPDALSSEREIRALLDTSAAGWNRGDLATYMAFYVDSAVAMGDGPRDPQHGRASIEAGMKQGFWRSGRPAQQLRYRDVSVQMLGSDHALVVGHFVLTGADRPERVGSFTTVWARTSAGWRIIHDHSG
jgi:uncharacterized protein (TIGR02246 family)